MARPSRLSGTAAMLMAGAFGVLIAGLLTTTTAQCLAGVSGPLPARPAPPTNCPTTAAVNYDWASPVRSDDFSDASSIATWQLYDGPGHAGNGRRTPSAVAVADGVLTITGDPEGNSEGMAWNPGQVYGRWEACVKSSSAAPAYHSLLLLWPDADSPTADEVDFMEISQPDRQTVDAFVHKATNDAWQSTVQIDATTWHSWAVEWTPAHVAVYLDGSRWGELTNAEMLPRAQMHLCIQLDNTGGDIRAGGQEMVDWVREYGFE